MSFMKKKQYISLYEASKNLKNKKWNSQFLVKKCLKNIFKKNFLLKNFSLLNKSVLSDAINSDRRRSMKRCLSPIDGIPISIKDIIITKNSKTTASSNILRNNSLTYNSTIVNKLKKCGAIIIGKTNMDEFAMGGGSTTGIWGVCKNSNNITKTTGGSSGGAANAITSNMCLGSIGTDTGGSVRLPSTFCNTVGLKPTYGRISRFGIIAFASSLDHVGVITKDVLSSAVLLQYISGYDSRDMTSSARKVDNYIVDINKNVSGTTVGIPIEYLDSAMNTNGQKTITTLIYFLKHNNIRIKYISLKKTEYALPVYYIIAMAEAMSNLSRYTGSLYGEKTINIKNNINNLSFLRGVYLGSEVKKRIMIGSYLLTSEHSHQYYYHSQKIRYKICQDVKSRLASVDFLITLTSPILPYNNFSQPNSLDLYLMDLYTVVPSLSGLPSISLNINNQKHSGIQIIGRPFCEKMLLNFANIIEKLL